MFTGYFKGSPVIGIQGPPGPDGNPIGTIISLISKNAPEGYLICDGAEHNISDYPDLARHFKAEFGSSNHYGGDGLTTFAVPDLRNLFLRGYHCDGPEQVSGEIGVRQQPTWQNLIGLETRGGSSLVGYSDPDIYRSPTNVDYSYGASKGYRFLSSATFAAVYNEQSQYVARPVNAAVLYCVKAKISTSKIVISSYVTDDGWKVRRYPDGYAEITKTFEEYVAVSEWSPWSNLQSTRRLNTGPLPIDFQEIYSSKVSIIEFNPKRINDAFSFTYGEVGKNVYNLVMPIPPSEMNAVGNFNLKYVIKITGMLPG